MSVVLLVRHGQASFGTDDYDRQSPRGMEQSHALGTQLGQRGITPSRIITGGMLRQRQTAQGAIDAAAWAAAPDNDPDWNEFSASVLLKCLLEEDSSAITDVGYYPSRRLLAAAGIQFVHSVGLHRRKTSCRRPNI